MTTDFFLSIVAIFVSTILRETSGSSETTRLQASLWVSITFNPIYAILQYYLTLPFSKPLSTAKKYKHEVSQNKKNIWMERNRYSPQNMVENKPPEAAHTALFTPHCIETMIKTVFTVNQVHKNYFLYFGWESRPNRCPYHLQYCECPGVSVRLQEYK